MLLLEILTITCSSGGIIYLIVKKIKFHYDKNKSGDVTYSIDFSNKNVTVT